MTSFMPFAWCELGIPEQGKAQIHGRAAAPETAAAAVVQFLKLLWMQYPQRRGTHAGPGSLAQMTGRWLCLMGGLGSQVIQALASSQRSHLHLDYYTHFLRGFLASGFFPFPCVLTSPSTGRQQRAKVRKCVPDVLHPSPG